MPTPSRLALMPRIIFRQAPGNNQGSTRLHPCARLLFGVGALLSGAVILPPQGLGQIAIQVDPGATPLAMAPDVRGSNLPAWMGTLALQDTTLRSRTLHSGTTLIRIPGGSWSNSYTWNTCEIANKCPQEWGVARPSDFIDFLQTTGQKAIYTVNPNGTAKEAAALVAFFNGDVNDDRVIGFDHRGRDWGKVSNWARIREAHGNPEPFPIVYWEFGNEVYGGEKDVGKDCQDWGWEEVWTCDGTEYVQGIGTGAARHEGYLEFREAMRAIDPSIKLGAVGVSDSDAWAGWGNEVIAAAGTALDFYVIHEYAYYTPPADRAATLGKPQATWPKLAADIRTAFTTYGQGRTVPLAITEYNMFADQEQDNGQWMRQAVNLLFIADTLGQMYANGISMANQWVLVSGTANNGTDFGLLNDTTFARNPQYFAFPLWARFGSAMIPVHADVNAASELSLYAGQVTAETVSLLAINKTDSVKESSIELNGRSIVSATADEVFASSLSSVSVTYNGVQDPSDTFSNAPSLVLAPGGGRLAHTFPPYSVTLILMKMDSAAPPASTAKNVVAPLFLLLDREQK